MLPARMLSSSCYRNLKSPLHLSSIFKASIHTKTYLATKIHVETPPIFAGEQHPPTFSGWQPLLDAAFPLGHAYPCHNCYQSDLGQDAGLDTAMAIGVVVSVCTLVVVELEQAQTQQDNDHRNCFVLTEEPVAVWHIEWEAKLYGKFLAQKPFDGDSVPVEMLACDNLVPSGAH